MAALLVSQVHCALLWSPLLASSRQRDPGSGPQSYNVMESLSGSGQHCQSVGVRDPCDILPCQSYLLNVALFFMRFKAVSSEYNDCASVSNTNIYVKYSEFL